MLWWRKVHRRQQPERIEIFTFSGLSLSCLVDTNWLQFQQYFSDSVSSISSVKHAPANAIKISAAILQTVNLLSFSPFDRCDSDKPEKINILLLSGCCLWTLHDHKTLGDKKWDEFTKPFKKHSRGLLVTPAWRDKVPVLYVILRAQ